MQFLFTQDTLFFSFASVKVMSCFFHFQYTLPWKLSNLVFLQYSVCFMSRILTFKQSMEYTIPYCVLFLHIFVACIIQFVLIILHNFFIEVSGWFPTSTHLLFTHFNVKHNAHNIVHECVSILFIDLYDQHCANLLHFEHFSVITRTSNVSKL